MKKQLQETLGSGFPLVLTIVAEIVFLSYIRTTALWSNRILSLLISVIIGLAVYILASTLFAPVNQWFKRKRMLDEIEIATTLIGRLGLEVENHDVRQKIDDMTRMIGGIIKRLRELPEIKEDALQDIWRLVVDSCLEQIKTYHKIASGEVGFAGSGEEFAKQFEEVTLDQLKKILEGVSYDLARNDLVGLYARMKMTEYDAIRGRR